MLHSFPQVSYTLLTIFKEQPAAVKMKYPRKCSYWKCNYKSQNRGNKQTMLSRL